MKNYDYSPKPVNPRQKPQLENWDIFSNSFEPYVLSYYQHKLSTEITRNWLYFTFISLSFSITEIFSINIMDCRKFWFCYV